MQRLLITCGLAPAAFTIVLLVEGAVRPGYATAHHFGSELSLGPGGWVQVANFVVTGLFTMAFAVGLRRALPSGRGSVAAPVLTAVYGATLVVAGVFSTDAKQGYPSPTPAEPTVEGFIHDLNSLPNFVALAATTFVMAARFASEPGRRAWMWCSLAAGAVVIVTFLVSAGLYAAAEQAGTLAAAHHGIWQRISILVGFGWLSALAIELLRGRT